MPSKNWRIFLLVFLVCDITAGSLYHHFTGLRVRSAAFGTAFKPSFRKTERWGPYSYRMITNSLGFRDASARRVSLKKTTPQRLLLLGDSFIEGIGINYEETAAGLLQEKLAPQGVEVLNAGMSAYHPWNYLNKTRYWLKKGLEFDQAVVFLDISDIPDEVERTRRLPSHHPRALKNKAMEFLKNHSILFHLFFDWKYKHRDWPRIAKTFSADAAQRPLWTEDEKVYKEFGGPGLELAARHLNELRMELKERKIEMALVIYPWPQQILSARMVSVQTDYWSRWCKEKGVPLIDAFPYFRAGDAREKIGLLFIPGDNHWNEAGHALMAEIFLREWGGFKKNT